MQTNVAELLVEAGTLLIVGMSVVFVFLSLLIAAVHLIAWLNRKLPETRQQVSPGPERKTQRPTEVPPATIAAIGAAMHQYRRSHSV